MSSLQALVAALALIFFLAHVLWAASAVDNKSYGSAVAQVLMALLQGALLVGIIFR